MSTSRVLIQMAQKRLREGAGRPAYSTGRRFQPPPLRVLFGDIPFIVIGGVATALYMPERMTMDTDVLIAPLDADRTWARLNEVKAIFQGKLAIGGQSWMLPRDGVLDIVVLNRAWVAAALAQPVIDSDSGLPIVALPYLALMKLESSRTQDLADISRMMGCANAEAIEQTLTILSRYRPQDVEDLESLIKLGKMEHG